MRFTIYFQRIGQGDLKLALTLSPQTPLEVLDVYPPHRHQPPLSPEVHVVSVDEDDVDFDTGGKTEHIRVCVNVYT